MLVTRIAPTPSGYLHAGNAVNFLLTSWLARQNGGRLLLRIDDVDAARARPVYVQDIFAVVRWLGLSIDGGARAGPGAGAGYWMGLRGEDYRAALGGLQRSGALVYACRCSRRDLAKHASRPYPGTCRDAGHSWLAGVTALRIAVPRPCPIRVAGGVLDLSAAMGDFVVWRRDDVPGYQLASVVADRDLSVTAIVRGADLIPSTAAQLFLAPMLGAPEFGAADIRHHRLIVGPDGRKLSKSAGARGRSLVGDAALRERIVQWASELAPTVGVQPCSP